MSNERHSSFLVCEQDCAAQTQKHRSTFGDARAGRGHAGSIMGLQSCNARIALRFQTHRLSRIAVIDSLLCAGMFRLHKRDRSSCMIRVMSRRSSDMLQSLPYRS